MRLMISFLALPLLFTAVPAQAASVYPETRYHVSGDGGVTKGNIIWYNRTVRLGGYVQAMIQICARVQITASHGRFVKKATRSVCNGRLGYGFPIEIDVPGGVQRVRFDVSTRSTIYGASRKWLHAGSSVCTRRGCS